MGPRSGFQGVVGDHLFWTPCLIEPWVLWFLFWYVCILSWYHVGPCVSF